METCLTIKNLQHHSWALMVQEQSNSGLSIRDWCSQNNISTKTFLLPTQAGLQTSSTFLHRGDGAFILCNKQFITRIIIDTEFMRFYNCFS